MRKKGITFNRFIVIIAILGVVIYALVRLFFPIIQTVDNYTKQATEDLSGYGPTIFDGIDRGIMQLTNLVEQKIAICHATESGGYEEIFVSKSASLDGHASHENDIIPPFDYDCGDKTCHYVGAYWTPEKQTILDNHCSLVTPTPTSAVATVTPGGKCQYDPSTQYPTGQNQMMAHLYKTGGFFMIANAFKATPEKYGAGERGGSYYIDVSYNSDFSGTTCDSLKMYPFDAKSTTRGANCQTFLGLGIAYQPIPGSYFATHYNNIAEGNIYTYKLGDEDHLDPATAGNNGYFASQLGEDGPFYPFPKNSGSIGGMEYLNIHHFWANWQCGKTLYWRFRDWNNASNISPTHADFISCNTPINPAPNEYDYSKDMPLHYDPTWDLNCSGAVEKDDTYRMEFMWMPILTNYTNLTHYFWWQFVTPTPGPI